MSMAIKKREVRRTRYPQEYTKRFAWIKAGRISDTDFYAWSERAREMKKKCDGNAITLDEFVAWLKQS